METLRAAKLLSATLLVCIGAACVVFAGPTRDDREFIVGIVLLVFGIPMLVRQWTGEGIVLYVASTIVWFFETAVRKQPAEPSRQPTAP